MLREIYRDSDIIVVDKPSGLLCVPGLSSPDNLYDQVKAVYPNARVVHRLDMATSGLVVFALHYEAQKAMGQLFEKRLIAKHYQALVQGHLSAQTGEVQLPIVCDWEMRPRQKICWQHGKPAATAFVVDQYLRESGSTRINLYPLTGRTHQLRVHMQAIGHAILGDALYLSEASERAVGRLMLHALALSFVQPVSGKALELNSPCPF